MHHLPRHHCWDPALKAREANKIIALSQEFQERGSPTFFLLRGTSGSEKKVKVKGEGRNWEMGRGLVESDSTYCSHHGLRISTHVAPCGHSAGSDTCNHSNICLTACCGSTDSMSLSWADLPGKYCSAPHIQAGS